MNAYEAYLMLLLIAIIKWAMVFILYLNLVYKVVFCPRHLQWEIAA